MVVVVGLGRREEGEVVARVGDAGGCQRQAKPEPGGADVRPHEEWAHDGGQQVREDVLHGVGVETDDANRGRPLVVLLVDVLVQARVVQHSEREILTSGQGHTLPWSILKCGKTWLRGLRD